MNAHLSAAVKHHLGWIGNFKVLILNKGTLGLNLKRTVTLSAFDHQDALTHVDGTSQYLAVRLEIRFMQTSCPVGEVDWCPSNSPWSEEMWFSVGLLPIRLVPSSR